MKKILLFLMLIVAFASLNTAKAQCEIDIVNVVVEKTVGPKDTLIGGLQNCVYRFNASFDIIANDGFKFLFFHSWKQSQYGTPTFNCSGNTPATNPPTATRLGTAINSAGNFSFMDFGFLNLDGVTFSTNPQSPTNITPNIATAYPNDASVILNHLGAQATAYDKGNDTLHFDVIDITVIIAGPCAPNLGIVMTDIWGSNANSNTPQAQCYICGRSQNFDVPTLSLRKPCTPDGTTWELGLTNPATNPPVNVVYRIYVDADNDGNQDGAPQDYLQFTSGTITLQPGIQQTFNGTFDHPYCCIGPWSYSGVYAVITVTGFSNAIVSPVVIEDCATLPIKLRSFDANRNKSNVDLKWVTEIEDNNKGFYVERMVSNGGWQTITFVASQAPNGNSNSPLTYVLTDLNNTKGISQYRLRQIDIDGKQAYSQIRSVRGEGQKSNTIIYPNPSGDGKVNIVFEGASSLRDVSLMDVSGKTLKQWKGVTNNNIRIDNLNTGFYTVRIVNVETGEQVVEKFIVNKR